MNRKPAIARFTLALALLGCLGGCGLVASNQNAGYADLESLSWRDVDTTVSLSIGPRLLRFAANAVVDDPQTETLLRSLEGVRVKVYRIEGDPLTVASDLGDMSAHLAEQGWEPAVRVLEQASTAHVLVKTHCGEIAGLTVLTSDGQEAVVVNIMGNLRPELFTQAMQALHVPQVPKVPQETSAGAATADT